MTKVGEIFEMVRAFMNDNKDAVYHNDVLVPYLKIAYDELKLDLEDYSIPINILTSDGILVTAGVTEIGGSDGPPLPAHLIEIIEIYERTNGTNNDYMQMTRQITLPKTEQQTTFLEVWTWQGQKVKLLGATSDIEIKMDYLSELTDVNNENSIIELTNCKVALAARIAALCAQFIEQNTEHYQACLDTCNNAVDKMLNIKIKSQQRIPIRRRPFMARAKMRNNNYTN